MNNLFIPSGFNIGPIHIAFYAICILLGAILAYILSRLFIKKRGYNPGDIENLFYIAFPMGIVGARIWYVIAQWNAEFASQPWYQVFAIWHGGLAIQGGIIGGVLAGVIFMLVRRKHIPLLLAMDCIIPTILLAQAIGRWGNFFNQEVYGQCVDASYWSWLPDFIVDRITYTLNSTGTGWLIGSSGNPVLLCPEGMVVVPLFLIEGTINILGFLFIALGVPAIFKLIKKYTGKMYLANGTLASLYLVWYGTVRFILEPMRNQQYIMGDYTSMGMSIAFIVIGVIGIVLSYLYHFIWSKKHPILGPAIYCKSDLEVVYPSILDEKPILDQGVDYKIDDLEYKNINEELEHNSESKDTVNNVEQGESSPDLKDDSNEE